MPGKLGHINRSATTKGMPIARSQFHLYQYHPTNMSTAMAMTIKASAGHVEGSRLAAGAGRNSLAHLDLRPSNAGTVKPNVRPARISSTGCEFTRAWR